MRSAGQEISRSMKQKAWIWRNKSSEKTVIITDKSDLSLVENEQEKERSMESEISLKDLNEQLSYAHIESNAKDDLLAKQAKVAEEALAGWEKAEAEAVSFKQELDEALLQNASVEERIASIDASLKECMQQLGVLNEEKQVIINDAALKTSKEQEKARMLEERLAETYKWLDKLTNENNNLSGIIEVKEKLIDELRESKSMSEANFNAVVERFDSTEKICAALNYEVCMLQKELEMRNKEREFNLKSADAAHKQHLESIKTISKLETECKRLRVMVRKRLPGPAAVAKMRSEAEMLGNSAIEIRRKRSNHITEGLRLKDSVSENCYDPSSKSVASLLERLNAVENENKTLKETLSKKDNELQFSRVMFARTASKLSLAETQLEVLSKGQTSLEIARSSPVSYDLPLGSISEYGCTEDSISCTESWASALISELEHFKTGKPTTPKCRTAAIADLSLMNDFVEMEKLAIVCENKTLGTSHTTSRESDTCVTSKETDSKSERSEATGLELVPMDGPFDASETNHRTPSSYISFGKHPNFIQDILKVLLQKHHIAQKILDAIVEEFRVALGKGDLSVKGNPPDALYVSGKSQFTSLDSSDTAFPIFELSGETSNQLCQSDLGRSVCKLVELIEGIIHRSKTINKGEHTSSGNGGCDVPYHKSTSLTGYVPHVFLWKSSELNDVLQRFAIGCSDLLSGKAHLEKFAGDLTSTLDWIINNCFCLQDVSSMKEMIKKHFDGDESPSDAEFEVKISNLSKEKGKVDTPEEPIVGSPFLLLTTSNDLSLSQIDIESKHRDENKRLKHEIINMESRKKHLEESLEVTSAENGTLTTQLQEPKKSISNLRMELDTLYESKGLIEDQIESQKLISEDLGTQLTVAKLELNEACQKFSTLEVELEEKSNCRDELEATCLEQQLQLESAAAKETLKYGMVQDEKQLRTDWEISAASEKLVECQEKILNLGKQLKALASPRDAALFDRVISTPAAAKIHHRPRLLDQLRAEDGAQSEDAISPKTKEIICTEPQNPSAATSKNSNAGLLYGWKILANHGANNSAKTIVRSSSVKSHERAYGPGESKRQVADTDAGILAIVRKRQKGGVGLLRKLLSRRKKEQKELMLPISS